MTSRVNSLRVCQKQTRRISIEDQAKTLAEERGKIKALLLSVAQKEGEIEFESHDLENKQQTAKDSATVRVLVEQRFKLEEERHKVEESRWRTEDELAVLEGRIEAIKFELRKALEKQNQIMAQLKTVESVAQSGE